MCTLAARILEILLEGYASFYLTLKDWLFPPGMNYRLQVRRRYDCLFPLSSTIKRGRATINVHLTNVVTVGRVFQSCSLVAMLSSIVTTLSETVKG